MDGQRGESGSLGQQRISRGSYPYPGTTPIQSAMSPPQLQAISAAVADAVSGALQMVQQHDDSNPGPSTRRSRAQGQVNLPSISLKRRSGNTKGKKPKTTLYDRDIVCLPFSYPSSGGRYAIPRKESRAFLASQGLIGKIRLSSDMDEDEILREIRSVFSVAMAYDTTFPITLLQWCGSGVNALAVPSLSQSFAWTAREVIRLAGQGCIYVKAEKELILPECQRNVIGLTSDTDISSDELPDVNVMKTRSRGRTEDRSRSPRCGPSVPHSQSNVSQVPRKQQKTYDLLESGSTDEDENFQAAIADSLRDKRKQREGLTSSNSSLSLHQIISTLEEKVVTNADEVTLICVRRNHLWSDSIKQFSKAMFDHAKSIRIIFHGEEGVDGEGPRREYFRLLCTAIQSESGLFVTNGRIVNFTNSPVEYLRQRYRLAGVMIASAIVHGGLSFPLFPEILYNYMVTGSIAGDATPEDIVNCNIKKLLQEVLSVTSDDDLHAVLAKKEILSMLEDCGYTKYVGSTKLSDRVEIVNLVCLREVLLGPKPAIDQFLQGLDCLGVAKILRDHPEKCGDLFVAKDVRFTAADVYGLFNPQYSLDGSNLREKELETMTHWLGFLEECEREESGVSLKDVIIFATGADQVPVLGFTVQPKINFSTSGTLPNASTCSLVLTLPMDVKGPAEFSERMRYALQATGGFGQV